MTSITVNYKDLSIFFRKRIKNCNKIYVCHNIIHTHKYTHTSG